MHNFRKSPACARSSRYSGRYRPAWRINHTGGGHTASPFNTFINFINPAYHPHETRESGPNSDMTKITAFPLHTLK
jgi:hypothetical protein